MWSDHELCERYDNAVNPIEYPEIAAALNACPVRLIIQRLKRNGKKVRTRKIKHIQPTFWTPERDSELMKYYNEGLIHQEIAVIMGKTKDSISTRIKVIKQRNRVIR